MAPLCSGRGESGSRLEPSQFHQHYSVSSATLPCAQGSSPPAAIFCLLFPGVATLISTPPSSSELKYAQTNAKHFQKGKAHFTFTCKWQGYLAFPVHHVKYQSSLESNSHNLNGFCTGHPAPAVETHLHAHRQTAQSSKVLGFTWTEKSLWTSFRCVWSLNWSPFLKAVLHELNSIEVIYEVW